MEKLLVENGTMILHPAMLKSILIMLVILLVAIAVRSFRAPGNKKAEAAHKAVQRVLDIIYPPSDLPSTKTKAKQPDPVAQLLKKFNDLTAAQKRRFLAGV